MDERAFIGMGRNPHGKDIPLGLGMHMAQDAEALSKFSELTQPQRDRLVQYVHDSPTGDATVSRIAEVIQGLKDGRTEF